MKNKKKNEISPLRQKAEAILKHNHEKFNFNENEVDLSKLYYELEVHQIELQMQHEELLQSNLDTRNLAEKYQQLYDFAPTGYYTLSLSGQIVEVNLAGAKMLGKVRSKLLNSNFGFGLSVDSRPVYNRFFDDVFSKQGRHECEVGLELKDGLQTYLHLIGLADDSNKFCFLIVVDVTERRELMNLNKTLLESLPYPAMYIRNTDKVILDANEIALKFGFKLGVQCWHRFEEMDNLSKHDKDIVVRFPEFVPAEFDVKCNFCLSEKCMFETKEQFFSQLHAFGLIWDVYWIKISSEVYLHYFIDITERIRNEESLRKSELFLKQTQKIAMLGSYSLDFATDEWISSEILDSIFGIEKEYPKTIESWMTLIHPEWQNEMNRYFQEEVLGKKMKFDKEYKIIRQSDAQVRWIHDIGEIVLNNQQQPIKMIGTIQDITNSKTLELERKYLLASVENVPNRIVVKDLDLKVVSANKSWIISKGEDSIDNLVGKTDAEVFGLSPDSEPVRSYMAEDRKVLTLSPGEFIESELPVKLYSGEDTIASLRRYPIFDDKGKLFCIGCIATDITERKKSEAALQQSEALFRLLAENSTDMISRHDLSAKFLYVSPACRAIFGYEADELLGHSLTEFVHTEDLDTINKLFEKLSIMPTVAVTVYQQRCKNGEFKWIETSSQSVFNNDRGNLLEIHASSRNVTDRKEKEFEILTLNQTLEQRVNERTSQLEDANKELEAFSYSVSHDLRAPLRHISGFSEMLAKDTQEQLSDKGRHYLEVINDAAHKMVLLIDDLLEFSRTSRMEINKSTFKMNKVLDEAYQLIIPVTENRNIAWEIADMPTVVADYNLIRLVWVNLLDNALKYTRKKDNVLIQIDCELVNHEAVFSIKDNGVGFDMKYAEKLFGVFQRLHSTSEFEGTGIGLANVRRIILRHGGRTWAESELDKGAKFYFTLPKRK